MIPLLKKIDSSLEVTEKVLVVVLFSALVLLVVINIISRNIFHVSFQKILETAPALVLWLALLGSTIALKENRHIKLDILLRFCPGKVRIAANAATGLFGMIVMGILFYTSLEFVKNETEIFGSAGWISIVFPLFFGIALFRYGMQLLVAVRGSVAGPSSAAAGEK